MKLAFLATTAVTTTTVLIPLGLTNLARAQSCDEMLSIRDVVVVCENNDRNPDHYSTINKIYQEVLGREVDALGLRTWSRELEKNNRLKDIRRKIARSREAQIVINQIYQEVLGRNVDPSGLRTFTKHLAKGWSKEEVRQTIQQSDEAMRRSLLSQTSVGPTAFGLIKDVECLSLNPDRYH